MEARIDPHSSSVRAIDAPRRIPWKWVFAGVTDAGCTHAVLSDFSNSYPDLDGLLRQRVLEKFPLVDDDEADE